MKSRPTKTIWPQSSGSEGVGNNASSSNKPVAAYVVNFAYRNGLILGLIIISGVLHLNLTLGKRFRAITPLGATELGTVPQDLEVHRQQQNLGLALPAQAAVPMEQRRVDSASMTTNYSQSQRNMLQQTTATSVFEHALRNASSHLLQLHHHRQENNLQKNQEASEETPPFGSENHPKPDFEGGTQSDSNEASQQITASLTQPQSEGQEASALNPQSAESRQESTEVSLLQEDDSSQQQLLGRNAPNSSALPMPNEKGIIIFSLHIPKTGGTSLMGPFVQHPDWRYRMVYGPGKQARYAKELYSWLENWENNTRVYYEYHAGKASPYMDPKVREDVHTWRRMAKEQGIPFFAFTVVREPLSFAVSHFNFYYASGKQKDNRYYWVPWAQESDFLELSLPNPQCLFCVHSEVAYYEDYRDSGKPTHVPKEGCEAVYDAFLEDFDWIGTTETLSDQTFRILEQMGNVRYCPEVRNKSKDKIKKNELSEHAINFQRNITRYDMDIYQRAKRDFPISMWTNFDSSPRKPHNPKKRCKYKTGQMPPHGELPKRPGEKRRFLEKYPDYKVLYP